MSKNLIILVSVAGVLAMNWACMLITVLFVVSGVQAHPVADVVIPTVVLATAAVYTPAPTRTPLPPTDTPAPTLTPAPTNTPTIVPRVLAPLCEQIMTETSGMTDVSWEQYKKDIVGKWVVDWVGSVTDVGDYSTLSGGWPLTVSVVSGGIFDDCSLFIALTSKEQALQYKIDQKVVVTGQIRGMMDIFGKVLYIKTDTATVTAQQ